MKAMLVLLLTLSLAACSEPFIGIPGGELQGTLTKAPASWGEVPDTVQLETRPSDPYSINIWAVSILGNLYVATTGDANWLAFIAADPRVRLRIDGKLYELLATRTTNAAEMAAVAEAYAAKYDYSSMKDGDLSEVRLFRLTPR